MKLSLLFILLGYMLNAQFTDIDWEKTFGSSLSEISHSLTSDGGSGYLIANDNNLNDGTASVDKGGSDVWVANIDAAGNIIWETTIGGTLNDYPKEILKGSDNAIYIVGYSKSNDQDITVNKGDDDILLVKLSTSGNLIWAKTYGGTDRDRGETIIQKANGNLLIGAMSSSSNGDVSNNYGSFDNLIMEIDTAGNVLWEKNYGGTGTEQIRDIKPLLDGNFIMTGLSTSSNNDSPSNNGSYDYLTIKFNDTGAVIWSDAIGGSSLDFAESILPLSDSSIIIGGYSYSKDFDVDSVYDNIDIWIINYDKNGNINWKEVYGGSDDDILLNLIELSNGEVYGIGSTSSNDGQVSNNYGGNDVWLININPNNGNLLFEKNYGGDSYDQGIEIIENNTNDLVFIGRSSSDTNDVSLNIGGSDSWLVKLNPSSTSIHNIKKKPYTLYPNPITRGDILNIDNDILSIKIIDVSGKIVHQNLNLQHSVVYAPKVNGVYFVQLVNNEGSIFRTKLIVR